VDGWNQRKRENIEVLGIFYRFMFLGGGKKKKKYGKKKNYLIG